MNVRRYRLRDREDVLDVWARASVIAHSFLGQEFLERERRDIRDIYLPTAETWVWDEDGRVVGFISLVGNEVGGIFVDPDHHRTGIGRTLMEKARAIREELEVEVFEENRSATAFYEALGFEPMRREVHDPTGFNIMRLRLQPH